MRKYVFAIVCSLISAVLAVFLFRQFESPAQEVIVREVAPAKYTNYEPAPPAATQRQFIASSPPAEFVTAAEAATPAVVNIKATQSGDVFDLWGSNDLSGASAGSGVIISPDGYIVTNNHVIEEGDRIEITLNNRRQYVASIIGTDPSTDLALLKVEGDNLPFLKFGDSDSLHIGEWVLAVGNPFNLTSTVTAGIVSAKARNIDILIDRQDRIESFIQTDAVVNPGNSGGALVNTDGELIGINTAIITKSGGYEGYSFAVPINLVSKVIKDLREFGIVQRGILGVFIDEMTNELAEELGLSSIEGVHIKRVTPDSGADDAGIRKGDVITRINGKKIRTLPEMQEQLGRYRPGNSIELEYIRNNTKRKVSVLLKNKSNSTAIITAKERDVLRDLGFEIGNLSRSEQRKLGIKGVRVISIFRGSIIEKTNMDPGFIITSFNGKPISSVDAVMGLLEQAKGKVMLKGIYENYHGEYGYSFKLR